MGVGTPSDLVEGVAAGVDMFDGAGSNGVVGSTGFGVRLLTAFVAGTVKKKK